MPREKAAGGRKTKTRGVEKRKKGNALNPPSFAVPVTYSLLLDPNAPKRGLSAYMFFANEQRENVREENPGITFGRSSRLYYFPLGLGLTSQTGQVGKLLGERWKALNEKQRVPYDTKAAADKKRYEEEKAAYQAQLQEQEDEEEEST